MKITENVKMYYFFDEAGDSQILGRGGVNLITEGKSSKVFIVFPELLKLCEHKNLRWDDNNLGTWLIIPKEKATSYIVLENAIINYKAMIFLKAGIHGFIMFQKSHVQL